MNNKDNIKNSIADSAVIRLFIAKEDIENAIVTRDKAVNEKILNTYWEFSKQYRYETPKIHSLYRMLDLLHPELNYNIAAETAINCGIGIVKGELELFNTLLIYELSKQLNNLETIQAIDNVCDTISDFNNIFDVVKTGGNPNVALETLLIMPTPPSLLNIVGPIWNNTDNWPYTSNILQPVYDQLDKFKFTKSALKKARFLGLDTYNGLQFDEALAVICIKESISLRLKNGTAKTEG